MTWLPFYVAAAVIFAATAGFFAATRTWPQVAVFGVGAGVWALLAFKEHRFKGGRS